MSSPFNFNVDIEVIEGRAGLLVAGDLDMASVPQLDETIKSVVEQNLQALRLDLSGVTFADSSGLRLLLQTKQLAEARGFALEIVRPSEAAYAVIRISGAEAHLPFVDK